MSILVVDDSESFRKLIEKLLKKVGFKSLLFTESAKEAYELLGLGQDDKGDHEIDLILMDLNMPGTSGIEAVKEIKADPYYHDVPILMLTATSDLDELEHAFDAGATDYIEKPPHKVVLSTRIRAALVQKEEADFIRVLGRELEARDASLAEANEKLGRLIETDELTGLGSHKRFDEYLSSSWDAARVKKKPVGLALVSIDNFKPFNDARGYEAGNDCLKIISTKIREASKTKGALGARFSGDSFILVMPETPIRSAAYRAEKLRSWISGLRIAHGAPRCGGHVTVCIGVASLIPSKDEGPETIIHAASIALSMAKEEGPNTVETYKKPPKSGFTAF